MTIIDMLKNNADKYADEVALIELKPSKGVRLEIIVISSMRGQTVLPTRLLKEASARATR